MLHPLHVWTLGKSLLDLPSNVILSNNITSTRPLIKQGRCNEGFNAEPIAFAF